MLVLVVVQLVPDADPEPALGTLAANRRVVVRPPTFAGPPLPAGVELLSDARCDRGALAAAVRRSDEELVVVLIDDERPSPELAAALLAAADGERSGVYATTRRVHFLGRDVHGDAVPLAWRGPSARQSPRRLPGTIMTTPGDVAAIIDRLEAVAIRGDAPAEVGSGLVVQPLLGLARRLWQRRSDAVPGVVLAVLETYGEVLRAAQAWERRAAAKRAAAAWVLPPGFHDWRTPWGWLTLRDGTGAALREAVLDATPEAAAGAPMAGGRGTVWRLTLGDHLRAVLRWYRRGGAFRHLLRDRYFGWTPRPMVELATTEEVRRRGVAVPQVLAARVDRLRFGWYRGAIVTRELVGAVTFADVLRRHPAGALRTDVLTAVGVAIRDLHERGVYHRDLNAANILLTREDALQVWFIDFDRASVGPRIGARLRARSLRRLRRSLAKLDASGVPFSPDDAAVLEAAYAASPIGSAHQGAVP